AGRARGGLDLVRLGDVEADGLDAGKVDRLRPACSRIDLRRASVEQLGRELTTQPAVRSGDDGDAVLDLHDCASFAVGGLFPRRFRRVLRRSNLTSTSSSSR